MAEGFSVGAMVKWESQAAGRWAEKVGRIETVVPPKASPLGIRNPGFAREHESYTVRVGSRLYWPRVDLLRPVAASAEDTLRAAAPDMLAALVELVSLKDGQRDDNYEQQKPRAWQAARAAIAKATGQPPAAQAGKEE